MSSYNKVILMGNLTRDPEIKTTTTDMKIAKLGLAVNRKYRSNNETKEEVTFVDIDAFGKQAEVLEQYAKKGTGLLVEGRLRLETWQDSQSGANRSKLGVVLEGFQFVGGKSENNSGTSSQSSAPAASAGSADDFEDDDNIPF